MADQYRDGDAVLVCPHYYRKALIRHWSGPTENLWGTHVQAGLDRPGYGVRPLASPDSNIALYAHTRPGLDYRPMDLLERYGRVWVIAMRDQCSLDPDALVHVWELAHGTPHLAGKPWWPTGIEWPSSRVRVELYESGAQSRQP